MNIKISSPIIKAQLKAIAEFYSMTPEAYVSQMVDQCIPGRFAAYKAAKHDKEQAEIARQIAIGRKPNSQIAKEVITELGDRGTCCMGMELRYNGLLIATGICQGNTTNYEYFKRIKATMVEFEGANESRFEIEHGVMD
jgi:hypothetical protein